MPLIRHLRLADCSADGEGGILTKVEGATVVGEDAPGPEESQDCRASTLRAESTALRVAARATRQPRK